MDIRAFLNALPTAATSPYAYAAYALALAAWVASGWLGAQPQRESQKILQRFKSDRERNEALARLLGQAPPDGLSKKDLLPWVQLQTQAKSKTYLLIAYLATLFALIVIIVVALTGSARTADQSGRGPTVRFTAADGAGCLPLPAAARATVSTDNAEAQQAAIDGCQVQFPWAIDWRSGEQAKLSLIDVGPFERSDPDRTYRLGDAEWVVRLRPVANAPRLLIQLFDYAASDAEQRDRFGQFETIVRNKAQLLADRLSRDPKYAYLADLRIVRAKRQLASSPNETLGEWRGTNALLFLSGMLFRRNTDIVVRSQPFFGELALTVPEISGVQLDLTVDVQEFSQTADSHSLALLYALAMDARRLGYSTDIVSTFLGQAQSVAADLDSSSPGIAQLKSALQSALQQIAQREAGV